MKDVHAKKKRFSYSTCTMSHYGWEKQIFNMIAITYIMFLIYLILFAEPMISGGNNGDGGVRYHYLGKY